MALLSAPDPIRVLVVYHHLPHYRFDLFKLLENDETLEMEFAAAAESSDGSIMTIPGSLLQRFHLLKNVWFGPFLWQVGLISLIIRRRPHVILFLGDCKHLSTWVSAVLCRLIKADILFWTIGWFRPERGIHRLYKLAFYSLADRLLIYGEHGRKLGEQMGYPAHRMVTVYNSSSGPMATQEMSASAVNNFAQRLPPSNRLILTTVIRLNSIKKLDLLIEAAAILRRQARSVEVLLVGEGPERQSLQKLAQKLDVPLWLPGPAYSDEELKEAYDRTLVSVVPSSAGLTVLQSFRYGRPVITHDNMSEQVPECEAITSGVTGDFYRYGDVEDLAETIKKWVDRQQVSRAQTADDCRAALNAHWNAAAQAEIIGNEIRRGQLAFSA